MQPLLLAAALLATPNFPAAIERELNLRAAPGCTICHASDAGGAGTVVRPFGVYLRSRGLVAFDESSLHGALLAAAGERHSSSGTGVTDIDALKAGEDPNSPGGSGAADLAPAYGCASGGVANLLPLLALVLWVFAHRRSRGIADGHHRNC